MIETARSRVAQAANAALTTLYWQIGTRIRQDVLKERRAEYGAEILAALWRQLSWSHSRSLIPLREPLKRDFYAEMCRMEGWSTRTLKKKIDGMLYERTALSKKPEKLIREELGRGGVPARAKLPILRGSHRFPIHWSLDLASVRP